ncbi:Hypothetical predicted protein [Olea europaea subsp. europaea]|uniref:Uncharacterized protein n=1 Tax=Olea europaea subsp. europaea TaxID=158383 RepID=A0A8S0V1R2_OLEEU|nr:Hypothetical predicted protein [Olea europaea subsp. europaea]
MRKGIWGIWSIQFNLQRNFLLSTQMIGRCCDYKLDSWKALINIQIGCCCNYVSAGIFVLEE